MADIEQAIFAMLTDANSIPVSETARRAASTALAGLVAGRVFPVREAQEAALPGIVYFKVSGLRDKLLAAGSNTARPRFQFDIYAEGSAGYKVCKTIAAHLRRVLNGFRGVVVGVEIQSCMLEDENEPYEEEPELFRVSMDFMFRHREV